MNTVSNNPCGLVGYWTKVLPKKRGWYVSSSSRGLNLVIVNFNTGVFGNGNPYEPLGRVAHRARAWARASYIHDNPRGKTLHTSIYYFDTEKHLFLLCHDIPDALSILALSGYLGNVKWFYIGSQPDIEKLREYFCT